MVRTVLVGILGTLYLFARGRQAHRIARRAAEGGAAPSRQQPEPASVVIAQPVRSGDPALAETLAANLVHREARIRWLVDEEDGPARRICASLPVSGLDARTVVRPAPPAGVNPKSWKLAGLVEELEDRDVLLVLDDDTELTPKGLAALLAGLADGAALATGLPRYRRRGGAWSRLLAEWVDTNAPIAYLGLDLEPLSVNGMCVAMRVGDLRAAGGFEAILHEVADDLALAGLLGAGGIVQTSEPHSIVTSVPNGRAYLRIMHRWMRFALVLLYRLPRALRGRVLLELGAPPLLLAGAAAAALGPGAPSAAAVRSALLCGLLVGRERTLRRIRLALDDEEGGGAAARLACLVGELAQPLHVLHALAAPVVRWRGHRLRIRLDGGFTALTDGQPPSGAGAEGPGR